MPSSVKSKVLTACAARARSDRCSDNAQASSLKGSVTFAPLPPADRNAATVAANPFSGANSDS